MKEKEKKEKTKKTEAPSKVKGSLDSAGAPLGMTRALGKVGYWLVIVALFLIASLTVISALDIKGLYKLYVIQSGSMEPAIKTGALVAVDPKDSYAVGDIIAFSSSAGKDNVTTHRIDKIVQVETGTEYVTKGDANNAPDIDRTKAAQVIGKVVVNIPFLGYPIGFAKTLPGMIALIFIPAGLIIISEISTIINEVKRMRTEKVTSNK